MWRVGNEGLFVDFDYNNGVHDRKDKLFNELARQTLNRFNFKMNTDNSTNYKPTGILPLRIPHARWLSILGLQAYVFQQIDAKYHSNILHLALFNISDSQVLDLPILQAGPKALYSYVLLFDFLQPLLANWLFFNWGYLFWDICVPLFLILHGILCCINH